MKFNIKYFLPALTVYLACEKPLDPRETEKSGDGRMLMIVDSVYLKKDSAGGQIACDAGEIASNLSCSLYFRVVISKDLSTWNPENISGPILYQIFWRYGGADSQWMWLKENIAEDTVVFAGSEGKAHVVSANNSGTIYLKANRSEGGTLTFGCFALTSLTASADGQTYSQGLPGATVSFSLVGGSGQASANLLIHGGATHTSNNVVTVSGIMDTAKSGSRRILSILYYRYSAIVPFDSVGVVFDPLLRDSLNPAYNNYMISNHNLNPMTNPDSMAWIPYMPGVSPPVIDSSLEWIHKRDGANDYNLPFALRKKAEIPIESLSTSNFFDTLIGIPGTTKVRFLKVDTLLPWLGQKWVVMRFVVSSGPIPGRDIFDDIAISPYEIQLNLDLGQAEFFKNEIQKKICILTSGIPFHLNTFGDTTFAPVVSVWLATRKLSASFFNPTDPDLKSTSRGFNPKSPKIDGAVQPLPAEFVWPDCIFETVPRDFSLTSNGEVRDKLAEDLDHGLNYRVSPLAGLALRSFGFNKSNFAADPKKIEVIRSDSADQEISRLIRRGSILGYDTARLDSFKAQRVYGSNTRTLIKDALGWHRARELSALLTDSGFTLGGVFRHTQAAGFCLDLDSNLYRHPIRGLPLTSGSIKEGVKEFILLAYGEGRFFREPRVVISRLTSQYSFVWDKIQPHFFWSLNTGDASPKYNPLVDQDYAPMCYKDPDDPSLDKCTDLSNLGGAMRVYLSTLPPCDSWTAVRDAGFGQIRTVKILFNYHDDYLGSDPVTGSRRYIGLDKYQEVPADFIKANQQKSTVIETNCTSGIIGESYSLSGLSFTVDISGWSSGFWDVWVETRDSFGNWGLAPYGEDVNASSGKAHIRQIEIK